jgi:hypothetical protein
MRGAVGAAQMKSVLDAVLFLAWVAGYLAAVSWVVRYRKTKVGALGGTRNMDYRGDKDLTLRLAILVLGAVMLLVGYIATRMVGQYF